MPDTSEDKEFLTRLIDFASHKAVNGVYLNQMYSVSRGCPALVIVALGDQALALQEIVMAAAVPNEATLIERVGNAAKDF